MICGDGTVQPSCNEECDDGNTTSGDGCSSTCQSQPGLGCPFTPLAGCRLRFTPAKSSIEIIDRERIGGLKSQVALEAGRRHRRGRVRRSAHDHELPALRLRSGHAAHRVDRAGGRHLRRHEPEAVLEAPRRRGLQVQGHLAVDPSRRHQPGQPEGGARRQGGGAGPRDRRVFEFPSNGGLGLPDLAAIQQPLRIQVQNSTGLCFETAFSAPPDRQDPNRFEDLGD